MAFRFWRRFKIAPGVTLNISKSSPSISFGPRGARLTLSPKGQRATLGIPGTGLFYTKKFSKKESRQNRHATASVPGARSARSRPSQSTNADFFRQLFASGDEANFVNGCRELAMGNHQQALQILKNALHLADGAFVAGFLALKANQLEEAERYLKIAANNQDKLGALFSKYGIELTVDLLITDEISAFLHPEISSILLGLVEIYQKQSRPHEAIESLERLLQIEPKEVLALLSLSELLWETRPENDTEICRRIINLSDGIENNSPIHAGLLLYRAKAFRKLGMHHAALTTLSSAIRKKRERSDELLQALRYERALTYEETGQLKKARIEFEKLYAEEPNYMDVASRLGLSQSCQS